MRAEKRNREGQKEGERPAGALGTERAGPVGQATPEAPDGTQ